MPIFKTKETFFEVFDSMLITIRLMQNVRINVREMALHVDGKLDDHQLIIVTDMIIEYFALSGVRLSETEKKSMRSRILATYDEESEGIFSIQELVVLFDSVLLVSNILL